MQRGKNHITVVSTNFYAVIIIDFNSLFPSLFDRSFITDIDTLYGSLSVTVFFSIFYPAQQSIFYRAAYMQGGLSYGKGVCLSICPSVSPSHA